MRSSSSKPAPISSAAVHRPDFDLHEHWWYLYTVQKLSVDVIAKRTGFHYNTVSKYLLQRKKTDDSDAIPT